MEMGMREPYIEGVAPDPDALAAEDLVEGAAVLAVAVADQEADALI
jgi:hypothetical protein